MSYVTERKMEAIRDRIKMIDLVIEELNHRTFLDANELSYFNKLVLRAVNYIISLL